MTTVDYFAGRKHLVPNFYYPIVRGLVPGYSVIHKTGSNPSATTSLGVVSPTGTYQMPTSPVTLEAVSSSANDTAAGSGARTLTIEYIDSAWALQTETISLNGITAVPFTGSILRLLSAHCGTGGSYPTALQGTNAGTITIRVSGGGTTWTTIGLEDSVGLGQAHIGAYTVPTGYKAYLLDHRPTLDSGKVATIRTRVRHDADTTSAPTGDIHDIEILRGITGPSGHANAAPLGPLQGPCDIWFLAKLDAAGAISIDFELLLAQD